MTGSITIDSPVPKHPLGVEWAELQLKATQSRAGFKLSGGTPSIPPLPEGVSLEKTSVPSRENGRRIDVRIYRSVNPVQNALGKTPVHVNFHGSGFVLPYLDSDADFCIELAQKLQMIVIDGDYRKAPEFPFPAAAQDMEDVVQWVRAQADERTYHFDLRKLSVGGFSAGAATMLALSARLGKQSSEQEQGSAHPICACIALYPPVVLQRKPDRVDQAPNPPTQEQLASSNPHGFALTQEAMDFRTRAYVLPAVAHDDPDLSPLLYDAKYFPAVTRVACGDGDVLHDGGLELVRNIQQHGRERQTAEHRSIHGGLHVFDKAPFVGDARGKEMQREAYDFLIEGVRQGHARVDEEQ